MIAKTDISLVLVRNPFDRHIRDERVISLATMPTIAAMLREYLPFDADFCVSVDGELITRDEWDARTLRPGEQMVVMPMVQHGGGGILASIAMIAMMIVAPEIAAYIDIMAGGAFGAEGSIGFGLLTGAVGMAGSALIGGLLGSPKPPAQSSSSGAVSQSYLWNPATTQTPGGVIARAYGRVKLYGNIVAGYIENQSTGDPSQIAHMLIDLGSGPYSSLSDFQINDQPSGFYSGVTIISRMGDLNQEVIAGFNDTVSTHHIGAKVVLGTPVTRQTIGNDYDALEVLLTCPNGLYYANDAGGFDSVTIVAAVEISSDSGVTWTPIGGTAAVSARTFGPAGYWSLGSWLNPDDPAAPLMQKVPVWVEVQKGSSVYADHLEGVRQYLFGGDGYNSWRWMAQASTIATQALPTFSISGAAQSLITKLIRVDGLTRGTSYQVRVTNQSVDHTHESRYGDALYFAEIHEIIHGDFQYPRTVLAGVTALATNQLSGSIKFSCMADAAIVRVWNGSAWASQWSNNPAWVCWDILTQPVLDNSLNVVRYDGLDPSRLVLSSFVAWATFCDAAVPDGMGSVEPRCRYDGIFDTATTLWDAALQVCLTARAQLVMRGTSIAVVVDDVRATPSQLFSVGNTAVAGFGETYMPMQDRAASIEVSYINSASQYVRDMITVVNPAITESTAQRLQVGMPGITRASQAWRECNFRLKRNELLRRTGTLSVDIDALACTVGDMIWVQNDVTQWGVGGRAGSGSTTTRLVLDQSITLLSGKTYELKLRLDDDTFVTRAITTAPGTVAAVDVSVAFPSAPALYNVWAIGETNRAVKPFLVMTVARSGEQLAKLLLIEYNESLYGLDSGIPAQPTPDISGPIAVSALPAALADLAAAQAAALAAAPSDKPAAQQAVVTALGNVTDVAAAAKAPPMVMNILPSEGLELAADGTVQVYIELRFDLVNAENVDVYSGTQKLGTSSAGVFRIENVTSGATYTLGLHPFHVAGASPSSSWQTVTYTVAGKNSPPGNVLALTAVETSDGGVDLSWPEIADLDRADYGLCVGNVWAEPITWVAGTSYHIAMPQPGTYAYRVKARDTSGNLSLIEAVDTLLISSGGNVVAPGAAVRDAMVTVDELGNAIIAFDAIQEPQITSYELRNGATFETGTLLASTTGNSFSLPVLSLTGLTLWIKGVYSAGGYTAASFRIAFGASSLNQIQGLSWRVSEPDMVFSWGAVAGASQYVALFEDGGVSRVKVVATPEASFAIPKWENSVFRVFAIGSTGGLSPYNDINVTLTGVYNYNEIVNISLPITTGNYINLAYTAANQIKRVGLLGSDAAYPYASDINDADMYSFGYNWGGLPASSILAIPANWFRSNFWLEKNGFFESGVLDLGSVLSGKLLLNLSKTIAYAGDGPVSDYGQVSAGYMAGSYMQEIADQKAFLTVRLLVASDSPSSANWAEIQNGDWVTAARYVKMVIDVAMAGPLTDITVTAGYVTLDVPDITETGSATGVTSAGHAVIFSKTYNTVHVVIATARGAAKVYTGSITNTGCTLYVDYGTQQVDYFVKGY